MHGGMLKRLNYRKFNTPLKKFLDNDYSLTRGNNYEEMFEMQL